MGAFIILASSKPMLNIIEQLPGFIAWKDNHHRYLGCNRNLAAAYGFRHPDQIIGMGDVDFSKASDEALTFYRECDELALSGKAVKLIHNVGAPSADKSFLLEKKPLFNAENYIVGTIFQCHELKENIIYHLRKQDDKYQKPVFKTYKIGAFENPFDLSARELECLFCILRGMTAKRIADVLQLSKRTIEFYISNIKNKFGSLTKSELMVSSIQQGYMEMIPPRFINYNLQQLFD